MLIPKLEKNIGTLVEKAAVRYGERTLLHFDREELSVSYRTLNDKVNQFANALLQEGIEQGDHVGVMLPNCSEFPFTWLGLAKLGAVMVPINIRYQSFDLEYILRDSDATALVIHQDFLSIFQKVPSETHTVKKIFNVGGESETGIPLIQLASNMSSELTPADPDLDALMNIQYTSGTTGFPKGVMTTHEYWLLLGWHAAENSFNEEDVFLSMSPFYYMDPQWELLMTLFAGGTMVLTDKISMKNFARCVKKYPVTHFWAWEDMLYLPQFKEDKDHHLKFALLSAFSPELHREFEAYFHIVAREAYGMTEIGPGTSVPIEDDHMVGSGSVGKPPAFRQLRIIDDNGNDVAQDEIGELLVKGPGILKGYYKKPKETAAAFQGEYFRTGDLFRQDEDGYYYFVGRKKDMIRRMGDNISAEEVEHTLMSHPKILEAAVIGVPDRIRDEEVKAYVIPAPGENAETIPPEEIITFCLERIAKFKVPRYIEYREDFPRSSSYKVQKHNLIAEKENLTAGCYDRFAKP